MPAREVSVHEIVMSPVVESTVTQPGSVPVPNPELSAVSTKYTSLISQTELPDTPDIII